MSFKVGAPVRCLRTLLGAVLLLLGAHGLGAQQGTPPAEIPPPAGAGPAVYLLTFGPGGNVADVWGHNAIWIRDPARGVDAAYNWGMYSFDQAGFIGRLARGTMLYWMDDYPAGVMIPAYIRDNRSIYAQELNLTLREKSALVDYIVETDTDANRFYRYDYWRDNCSTRARDAIDLVIGGRIRAALEPVETGVTWRWQARRILRSIRWAYVGMEFALGSPSDKPTNEWNETFLPLSLMRSLRKVTVLDESGSEVPLVAREFTIFEASRPPEATEPPFWLPWFLLAGVVFGGVIVLAGRAGLASKSARAAQAGRRPRAGFGLMVAGGLAVIWSLVAGLAGLGVAAAWLWTDHWSWFRNENLLQASPLSLLLAALLVIGHFSRGAARWVSAGALFVLGLSVLGLLIQSLPGFDQMNGEIIAFALPVHAAVAWLAVQLGRPGSSSAG